MSYVLCRGYLRDENEICEDNIYEEDVYLSPNKSSNLNISINEAFARIMIRASQDPKVRNLIIYSDNQSACEEWESIVSLKHLSQLFDSVAIEFIPREKNKYADRLGRKKVVIIADKAYLTGVMSYIGFK